MIRSSPVRRRHQSPVGAQQTPVGPDRRLYSARTGQADHRLHPSASPLESPADRASADRGTLTSYGAGSAPDSSFDRAAVA